MKFEELGTLKSAHINEPAAILYEQAILRSEARVTAGGALCVSTGEHTGRSPLDKFIVRDADTDSTVWWANNKSMDPEQFGLLKNDFLAHANARELFVQDLFAGSEDRHRLPVRVICEHAWHALFVRHLLIRPRQNHLVGFSPKLTIVNLPSFKANPTKHGVRSQTIIACDFGAGLILIGGTSYAGEMKKSVFTTLNYLLPACAVMPMHCSANIGPAGDTALFFGLSGTGKTSLSADADRILLGDDEHGWSEKGIFNFEGGCYAKVIKLSAAAEPEIHAATRRFATILENVALDPDTRQPNFDDASATENTRAAYPLEAVANASRTGMGDHPRHIVMLTADAFGVLPPIAQLTPEQAIYYFLSGYTAKVAGTEKGVNEPQATFSTCFGAPFMPRQPAVYGRLLHDLIVHHKTRCWLVNTGWTGGPFGIGQRMPIGITRALLRAALDGSLAKVPTQSDRWFGLKVPLSIPGIDPQMLSPRDSWHDGSAYDAQATRLVEMFVKNFAALEPDVDIGVMQVANKLAQSA